MPSTELLIALGIHGAAQAEDGIVVTSPHGELVAPDTAGIQRMDQVLPQAFGPADLMR